MIDSILNVVEVRVLGALLEKSMTTPDYYPLSLNALINACNQKSNREPVVIFDEDTVVTAIDSLKSKQMVVQGDSGRVTKYAECFVGNTKLIIREAALICLLLLRGPQTIGELRGRSERMYGFADLAEVKETIENLAEMDLVRKMAKQPGRKESRFMHLMAGELDDSCDKLLPVNPHNTPETGEQVNERLGQLQEEVLGLREEMAILRQEFHEFKDQFN